MKTMKNNYVAFLVTLLISMTIVSCDDDDNDDPVDPVFADPTISVTVPEGGLAPEVGTTVTITIELGAEAGLSGLFLNDGNIKSFAGTETTATETYDQLIANEDPITLTFKVEDAQGTQITAGVITINPIPGEDFGFLLVDFTGESSGSEVKTVVDWDSRTKWTMNVAGEIGTEATIENVAGQGKVAQFAADNPDPTEEAKVLKYTKADGETSGGNWGGWTNLIIGLADKVPASEISALPTYDSANNALVAGTKVVAVDVYYDATVDTDFTWDDISNFEANGDIWNSDAAQGLKLDLVLGDYSIHGSAEVGYDNLGYYISYSSYIKEPNKWVTLKFELLDEGRTAFFYDNRNEENTSQSVGTDGVDCFNLKLSPGYDALSGGDNIDTNPIYFRNLRIIDNE